MEIAYNLKGWAWLRLFLIANAIILFPTGFVRAQQGDQPYYFVKDGDTLAAIASSFRISAADIVAINQLGSPANIQPGDRLSLPGYAGVHGELTSHTLGIADSLRAFSRRQQIPLEEILQLNPIVSPDQVPLGYGLVLPQADHLTRINGKFILAGGESLLALSVASDINPWLFANINGLENPQAAIPGDLLFAPQVAAEVDTSPPLPWVNRIDFTPLPLTQGHTFEIQVSASQDLDISGTWMGKPLHFFPVDKYRYTALSGVYALADPGYYSIALTLKNPDTAVYQVQQLVEIQSGGYPTDPHLTVPPETIDPAVTAPENELVARIVQPATPEKYWDGIFTCPGYNPQWITSWFGDRRYYNDDPKVYFHTGVDYNGGIGIPVKAAAAGVVVYTGEMVVRGNVTFIDHGWGIYTVYFHQSQIDVKVGDRVEPGQVIGLVGATGRVTGAHLHWELWVNGFQSDPLDWLDRNFP